MARKWSTQEIIKVQAQHEKFFEMYYDGLSKKKIAAQVAKGSVPLLEKAFPTINFSNRGSIKPEYMTQERWVEGREEREKRREQKAIERATEEVKKQAGDNDLKRMAEMENIRTALEIQGGQV